MQCTCESQATGLEIVTGSVLHWSFNQGSGNCLLFVSDHPWVEVGIVTACPCYSGNWLFFFFFLINNEPSWLPIAGLTLSVSLPPKTRTETKRGQVTLQRWFPRLGEGRTGYKCTTQPGNAHLKKTHLTTWTSENRGMLATIQMHLLLYIIHYLPLLICQAAAIIVLICICIIVVTHPLTSFQLQHAPFVALR